MVPTFSSYSVVLNETVTVLRPNRARLEEIAVAERSREQIYLIQLSETVMASVVNAKPVMKASAGVYIVSSTVLSNA